MTRQEAIKWVTEHTDDDEFDRAELESAYNALGLGPANEGDYDCDLWSHCCAEVL